MTKNAEEVKQIMDGCGIACYGVCSFARVQDMLLPCRAQSRLPEGAASVIVIAFPYSLGDEAYRDTNISRYAAVKDYHLVVSRYLEDVSAKLKQAFPEEEFVPFTDNSPVPEVFTAACAGLGVIGQNGLLIHKEYGSWVFLGEIVTTLALQGTGGNPAKCCGCQACVCACPTGALASKDIGQCLSRITQKKGELLPEEEKLLLKHGCAWGCDICQLVCPENQKVRATEIKEFLESFHPVAAVGEPLEEKAYAWRGRKVVERNLSLLERNQTCGKHH